jgi:hypothetical protein
MTAGGFDRPNAQLLIFPILSRNPVDFDSPLLSHKRQQKCTFRVAVRPRESESLCFSGNKRWITNKGCILGESAAHGL